MEKSVAEKSVMISGKSSTDDADATTTLTEHQRFQLEALVSQGEQLQKLDFVSDRLGLMFERFKQISSKSSSSFHTRSMKVLTSEIQYTRIKET